MSIGLSKIQKGGSHTARGPASPKRRGRSPSPARKRARSQPPNYSKRQHAASQKGDMLREMRTASEDGGSALKKWVREQTKAGSSRRDTLFEVFRDRVCRNCVEGSKGIRERSIQQCRQRGTERYLRCKTCSTADKEVKHWAEDCPKRRKA